MNTSGTDVARPEAPSQLSEELPWTNVYGIARSLIALGTLSSVLLHSPDVLFRPFGMTIPQIVSNPGAQVSLFAVIPSLQAARWIAVVILLVVISGWRPQFTGVLHWYVSLSFAASAFVVEGGDQIAAILTLLLIPVTLTDRRKWHWAPARATTGSRGVRVAACVAGSAWIMIRVQMAIIYLHAAIGKIEATEWANGTALYYWIQHPLFGAPPWLQRILLAAFVHPAIIVVATWGVIALELTLASGFFWERRKRPPLLVAGILFHLGIVVLHGLGSFFLVMTGGLLLYLRPPSDVIRFGWARAILALRSQSLGVVPAPTQMNPAGAAVAGDR